MIFLTYFVYLYLVVGVLYALYILFFAWEPWYYLIVNIIGGPVVLVYLICITVTNRRLPWREDYGV